MQLVHYALGTAETLSASMDRSQEIRIEMSQLNGKRGRDYGKPVLSQHCPRNGESIGDLVRYQPLKMKSET